MAAGVGHPLVGEFFACFGFFVDLGTGLLGDQLVSVGVDLDPSCRSQVYANGKPMISEKTCPQIDEEPEACEKLPDEW